MKLSQAGVFGIIYLRSKMFAQQLAIASALPAVAGGVGLAHEALASENQPAIVVPDDKHESNATTYGLMLVGGATGLVTSAFLYRRARKENEQIEKDIKKHQAVLQKYSQ